jgi:hypothetical protein
MPYPRALGCEYSGTREDVSTRMTYGPADARWMDSGRSASFHTGLKEVVASFATDNLPDYTRREIPDVGHFPANHRPDQSHPRQRSMDGGPQAGHPQQLAERMLSCHTFGRLGASYGEVRTMPRKSGDRRPSHCTSPAKVFLGTSHVRSRPALRGPVPEQKIPPGGARGLI